MPLQHHLQIIMSTWNSYSEHLTLIVTWSYFIIISKFKKSSKNITLALRFSKHIHKTK